MARLHKTGVAALLAAGAMTLAAMPAQAQVPGIDFYIGAGAGQSNVELDDIEVDDFDNKDFAWKVFAGARLLSMFGAELQYFDFGKPSGADLDVDYKGLGAYGLFYLPLPAVVDVYAKAGIAKIDVDIDGGDFNTDDTQFSYGVGVQLKLGSWRIRGEYERFKVKDGDLAFDSTPSLLSLSFAKSFL